MKAAEILGVRALRFIEPSYADLTESTYTALLTRLPTDQARLLIDEHEEPLALAFHDQDAWTAGTFLFRRPTAAAIEKFEDVNGDIYQEDRAVWAAAVREYFSLRIAEEIRPSVEDLNPARNAILHEVISDIWGKGSGGSCIDFCCGSGVGSKTLRNLGYSPRSCDNDPSLISLGLSAKRLLPEETVCIDATIASRYLDPVPRGIGIMMGDINTFTRDLWQQLATELFALTDETLITVGKQSEADLIRSWGEAMDRTVEVRENKKDPTYDRWVCVARKPGS
jgi:hypothetical protein